MDKANKPKKIAVTFDPATKVESFELKEGETTDVTQFFSGRRKLKEFRKNNRLPIKVRIDYVFLPSTTGTWTTPALSARRPDDFDDIRMFFCAPVDMRIELLYLEKEKYET